MLIAVAGPNSELRKNRGPKMASLAGRDDEIQQKSSSSLSSTGRSGQKRPSNDGKNIKDGQINWKVFLIIYDSMMRVLCIFIDAILSLVLSHSCVFQNSGMTQSKQKVRSADSSGDELRISKQIDWKVWYSKYRAIVPPCFHH